MRLPADLIIAGSLPLARPRSTQRCIEFIMKKFLLFLDKFESYFCQVLLAFFVCILFLQIMLRVCFNYVIPWSEEISRFAFVWFVFLGAAYAARLAAHNRVTIQFKLFPQVVQDCAMVLTDIIWIAFNLTLFYKSIQVINDLVEFPFMSPTLEWSMAYVYMVFPISFGLMTLRVIQVDIMKYILKIDLRDVDAASIEESQMSLVVDKGDPQPATEIKVP